MAQKERKKAFENIFVKCFDLGGGQFHAYPGGELLKRHSKNN
jgi:hypothetical protein